MSDYLERLMGKAKGGDFWDDLPQQIAAPPEPTEKHSVRRDAFDKSAWDQITDQVPALGEQVATAVEAHPTAGPAYEDLFNLLNQGDPRFVELAAMDPAYVPQHAMLQGMSAADDFQWVRNETRYDEYNTALAMLSMEKQMSNALDQVQEAIEEIAAAQEALAEAMAAAQAYLDGGQGAPGDGEGQPGDGEGGDLADIIQRLEDAMKGQAQAEEAGDSAGQEAAAMLKLGVSEAKGQIEQEKAQASAYGVEDGVLKKMDYAERRRLAQRLNSNRLTRFANLIGGTRMMADAERRRKVNHAPAEVYDVELGNDLHKMVASELNGLAMPETEDLLWIKYAQRSMLQWRTRGAEVAGKGPIIVVCDESGSMGAVLDAEGNTREAWSKAVTLGLVDQARRAKRDFIYIGFSSARQVWEIQFTNGIYDVDQIMDFAQHFYGGGTSYEGPLTRAMEIIGTYEKRKKNKPDVVFITDAECNVQPAFTAKWQEVKQRVDVRCFGIQIGGSGRYTAMQQLVDRCIQIDQLNASPEAVTDLFRTI